MTEVPVVKTVKMGSDCILRDGGGQNKGFNLREQEAIEGWQNAEVSELHFRRVTLTATWGIDWRQ